LRRGVERRREEKRGEQKRGEVNSEALPVFYDHEKFSVNHSDPTQSAVHINVSYIFNVFNIQQRVFTTVQPPRLCISSLLYTTE
jgi:hypothetical protein